MFQLPARLQWIPYRSPRWLCWPLFLSSDHQSHSCPLCVGRGPYHPTIRISVQQGSSSNPCWVSLTSSFLFPAVSAGEMFCRKCYPPLTSYITHTHTHVCALTPVSFICYPSILSLCLFIASPFVGVPRHCRWVKQPIPSSSLHHPFKLLNIPSLSFGNTFTSLQKHIWTAYSVPRTLLGARDTKTNKRRLFPQVV